MLAPGDIICTYNTQCSSYVMFPAEYMPSIGLDSLVLAMSFCTEDALSVLAHDGIIYNYNADVVTLCSCYVPAISVCMYVLAMSVCMYVLAMSFCTEDALSVLAHDGIICTYNSQM